MKKSDITEAQFKEAARLAAEAAKQLRNESVGRWWDDDYRNYIDDELFFGRFWRRVAKIHTVEDARRELLYVAERRQPK